jgi:hypothetical protein
MSAQSVLMVHCASDFLFFPPFLPDFPFFLFASFCSRPLLASVASCQTSNYCSTNSQPTEILRQVDAWGVVVCCWLHLSRIAVVYFSQHSPVLQAFAKAQNSEKSSLW